MSFNPSRVLSHCFLDSNLTTPSHDPLYPLGPAAAYVRRHCISQIAAAAADTQHSFWLRIVICCVSQQNHAAEAACQTTTVTDVTVIQDGDCQILA